MDEILLERIRSWQKGIRQPPYKVDLFITQNCNLRCIFCEFPTKAADELKGELTEEQAVGIAEQAGRMGARIFGILGGEPFFRPYMIRLMRTIKEHGMRGSMVTNGTLISEAQAQEISSMGWDFLRVSVDGDAETHDFLRGQKGAYSRTAKAIGYLSRGKSSNNHPTVEINTVLCNRNFRKIASVIRLAAENRIGFVYLLPMILFNSRSESLRIAPESFDEVRGALESASEYAKSVGVSTNIDSVMREQLCLRANRTDEVILSKKSKEGFVPCYIPWYGMSIDAHGNATPCSQFAPGCGESLKQKTLEEVWYGEKFGTIRKSMGKGILAESCSRCCVPLLDENNSIRDCLEGKR